MADSPPLVFAAVLHCGIRSDDTAKSLLKATLDSLLAMSYQNMALAVVDNGSTDGSQAMMKERYPGVTLIENCVNLGVMEGYNVGLREGMRRGADWILLLNNDIIVDPRMLSKMVEAGESDRRIGIVGPKMYFHDTPNSFWYAGGNVNFFSGIISHRGIREIDRGQYDRTEDTGYVNGCAMLIRLDVVSQIGFLDPIFSPMYSEDADYSLRAQRAGFRLVYAPEAVLWHKVSAFSGGGATAHKTSLKVQHNFIVLKRYARWYHWLTIPWCVGFATLMFIVKELAKGNFYIVGALFRGIVGAAAKIGSKS